MPSPFCPVIGVPSPNGENLDAEIDVNQEQITKPMDKAKRQKYQGLMFAEVGENCLIQENAIVGLIYKEDCCKTRIGNNAIIRAFSVIYADVEVGGNFKTGCRPSAIMGHKQGH